MSAYLLGLGQLLLLALLAPLATGWVRRVKARLQNRVGPPLLRPYQDLIKLLWVKETLFSDRASWLFRTAPYVIFAATLLAAGGVPVVLAQASVPGFGDAILLVGFLALARFFTALAAMDAATAFGGMGASREMILSALAEPAVLMCLFVLSVQADSSHLETLVGHTLTHPVLPQPSLAFALVALVMVALAECGRLPVDNPATHLELTMLHEAMVLEYSGRHLGLLEWGGQIKLVLFATLIIDLFFPWGLAHSLAADVALPALGYWLGKMLVLLTGLAILETILAKLRIFQVPEYLSVAFLLALLGMLTHQIMGGV
ncbi:MAG: NADH-quinone oxidoreductase subunit H [Magnetococcus sp. WYHC-3]